MLRFWGARPTDPSVPAVDGEPYHNLSLSDPILDPRWIDRFEVWMVKRPGCGPQTLWEFVKQACFCLLCAQSYGRVGSRSSSDRSEHGNRHNHEKRQRSEEED